MRIVVTLLGAILAGSLLATAASADPGNGAVVTDETVCLDFGFGLRCDDVHTVTNVTTTPSGNTSSVENRRDEFSVSGSSDGCTFMGTEQNHTHALTTDAARLQEYGLNDRRTVQGSCEGGAQPIDCTFMTHYHFANGELQPGRIDERCRQEP